MSLDDHIAAGYLLLKPVPRPEWASRELLPSRLLSASTCLCPRFPGSYVISWCGDSAENRVSAFEQIGLDPGSREDAITWATAAFDTSFGWRGVFFDLAGALAARQRFFATGDLAVIGLGLPVQYRDRFIAQATPPPPAEGYSPEGKSGFLRTIERDKALAPGGTILGYEPLSVTAGQIDHSWLCNHLEQHIAECTTIRPGPTGLVESLSDAIQCCEIIERPDVGAEPGPWLPWLITQYAPPN